MRLQILQAQIGTKIRTRTICPRRISPRGESGIRRCKKRGSRIDTMLNESSAILCLFVCCCCLLCDILRICGWLMAQIWHKPPEAEKSRNKPRYFFWFSKSGQFKTTVMLVGADAATCTPKRRPSGAASKVSFQPEIRRT